MHGGQQTAANNLEVVGLLCPCLQSPWGIQLLIPIRLQQQSNLEPATHLFNFDLITGKPYLDAFGCKQNAPSLTKQKQAFSVNSFILIALNDLQLFRTRHSENLQKNVFHHMIHKVC